VPKAKDKNICQVPFRMHLNDHKMMKKLLIDEGISFQMFTDACCQAFLRGDRIIIQLLHTYKDLITVPREEKDSYNLSHRERSKLLDEIEDMEGFKKEK